MITINQQVIAVLGMVLFIGLVLFFVIAMFRRRSSGLNIEKYRAIWLKIENSLDRNNNMTYQMAVLTADKLLNQAMADCGVAGNTMGDRLKAANGRFSNINDVWFAHKLRNRIAHDTDFQLNFITTQKALMIFKKALKELGAI